MNVYDFDKTIYDGDSTIDFFWFCMKKKPLIIRYIFKQCLGVFLYSTGVISKETMKEYFFSFLNSFENVQREVEEFWDRNIKKIKQWYLKQKRKEDVIISASPDFLLREICRRLDVQFLIATEFDTEGIKIVGKNCKGEEKVRCFKRLFGEAGIDEFYSDSLSDAPLSQIAQKAYFVKKNEIVRWPD